MLGVEGLCLSAGEFRVKDIAISVPNGRCHALLGGTGNGKTLILEAIAGLKPIAGGRITIDGRDVTKEPPERRGISYVPQDLALFPHLSVRKNIAFSRRFRRNLARSEREVEEIVEFMELRGLLDRPVHNLSGGERQRVALARAFAAGGGVMLLDEPFSALHYTMRRAMWRLLSDMRKKYGLSILMVTHDLEEAFFLADEISVLHQGEILQTGNSTELLSAPSCLEVTKIVGRYNYFSGEVRSSGNERAGVWCPALGAVLTVRRSGLLPGDKVTIAARTDSVKIALYGDGEEGVANAVACAVEEVREAGAYSQVSLRPECAQSGGEIEILADVFGGEGIEAAAAGRRAAAVFPEDKLFAFKTG